MFLASYHLSRLSHPHFLLQSSLIRTVSSRCGEVEDVVGALTPVVGGVAQVFHDLLVKHRLLLVAEVAGGEEEDRQEEGWEVESGVGQGQRESHTCGWHVRWTVKCGQDSNLRQM